MWWVNPNYKLNDLKAVETTTTKNTTGNMLSCNGLKCCKVPLFKRAYVQVQLKFVSEHLNNLKKAWEKVLWGRNVECDPKIAISSVKHRGGTITLWDCFFAKGTERLIHGGM